MLLIDKEEMQIGKRYLVSINGSETEATLIDMGQFYDYGMRYLFDTDKYLRQHIDEHQPQRNCQIIKRLN